MHNDLVGASVWEQTLYDHLTTHAANERELLVEYQQAAADSNSAAFRYLASLIVEDEMRHHRLLEELAESLKSDAELRPGEPTIPRLGGWGPDPHKVTELSDRLIEHEEMDLQFLRSLRKELDSVRDTTLWDLLVRLMELDTTKHTEILNFVRRHSRKALT
jgi:rubrerythrin